MPRTKAEMDQPHSKGLSVEKLAKLFEAFARLSVEASEVGKKLQRPIKRPLKGRED